MKMLNFSAVARATVNASTVNKIVIILFTILLTSISPLVLLLRVIMKTEKGEAYMSFSKKFKEDNEFPLELIILAIAVMVIAVLIAAYSLLKAIGFFDIEIEYLLLGL